MDELEEARFRIYALEDGAVRAQALAFCLRKGLFDQLESAPLTAPEIGAQFGLAPRVLPALLAFLVSQGLLFRDDGARFANTSAASTFLVRRSPRYVGGRGLLFAGFYGAIAHLPEALESGQPWTPEGQHDMFEAFSEEDQRWFAEGMFANAVHGGKALLEVVDFSPCRRLLDVGGSAGGYTIAILERHPALEATILDLPAVEPLARQRIAAAGMEGRIQFVAGSFFEDSLPRGHDAILLSSILHDWGNGECAAILRNCFRGLEPGGLLVVTEPMLREDFTGPDHPSVSGLTMAVLGGENRTPSQVARMLAEAGFEGCWQSPVGPQNSVVTARKPAA
jgi:predicted O-methyltransferase YrrM